MNISEILNRNPEELLALSDEQLKSLLEPFFPAVRQAVLPPEKSRKLGLDRRMIESYINATEADLKALQKRIT